MWEQDANFFLATEALLPLALLCQTTSPRDLLAQVAQEVGKIEEREARLDTAACTEILAGLRFDKSLIRQLLSEDIMQESVIYQDILQKGERQGEQKGEQQEAFKFLSRQLNRRFGAIDSLIIDRLRVLSTEQLEILGEEFLSFSNVANLVDWLDRATADRA
jgi:predicted transposase YdaD